MGSGFKRLTIAGGVLANCAGLALLDAGKRDRARRLYVALAIIGVGLYIGTATAAANVSAGEESACAVLSGGHVECWGENESGELGDATTTGPETCSGIPCSKVPVDVSDITDATQVSTGYGFACARLSGGHVECWGRNEEGELGNGTTTNSDTPVEVSHITGATQVSTGFDATCALLSSRHVKCWGSNKEGELGNGTTTASSTPVKVSGITDATQLSAGVYFTCAGLSTGHVECWGEDRSGQLGNDTYTEYEDRPADVTGITDDVQVSAGFGSACALLSSGQLECWGDNYYGQLGDGTTGAGEDTPVEVSDVAAATQVSTGNRFACALLPTGHAECWGHNLFGDLGDNSTTNSDTPVEVSGLVVSTCATAVGGGVYEKVGEEGHFRLENNLATNLEAPQMLHVNTEAAGNLHLIKLDKATCTGEPGERDFQGEGTAAKDGQRGFVLSFSIYEKEGGVFFQSKLIKGAEEVEASGGPLTTSTEVIR